MNEWPERYAHLANAACLHFPKDKKIPSPAANSAVTSLVEEERVAALGSPGSYQHIAQVEAAADSSAGFAVVEVERTAVVVVAGPGSLAAGPDSSLAAAVVVVGLVSVSSASFAVSVKVFAAVEVAISVVAVFEYGIAVVEFVGVVVAVAFAVVEFFVVGVEAVVVVDVVAA